MTHYVKTGRIPETEGAGRLGRHIYHDSRSLRYPYLRSEAALKTVTWPRNIAILDQGNLGSCTGNAMVGALGTSPIYAALPVGHPVLDEKEAVSLYSSATHLDSYPGEYPPTDTGSDGLSVCEAAKSAGLLSGYLHALSLNDALAAVVAGPVLLGINWYSSFDTPAATGLVSITSGAYVRGGHEIVCRGIDTTSSTVLCDNSWGAGWGNAGSFTMSWATLERLLSEDGDCTIPVPVTAPAPVPTPVPVPVPPAPTADDVKLWQGVHSWAVARHYTTATRLVASDLRTWAKAKGFYGG